MDLQSAAVGVGFGMLATLMVIKVTGQLRSQRPQSKTVYTNGIMTPDYKTCVTYLNEAEAELLNIGVSKCNGLHDRTQLSAVIFLLLRATSILRSVLLSLESGQLDAYDTLRRAYLEAWLLAYEFRLEESGPNAARWHMGQIWCPDIKRVESYSKSQGIKAPTLGKDYGGLSQVAHTTRSAAENSVVVITARRGSLEAQRNLDATKAKFELEDVPELMYRYLWLVLEETKGLIPIGANAESMPASMKYATEYKRVAP